MNTEIDTSSSGPFAEPTGNTSGIDTDALLSQVESGGSTERPMSAHDAQADAQPTQQKQPEPSSSPVSEISFTWNGKQIKAPLNDPRVTQWMSQGYDYAQRMQAFKEQQAQIEKQRAELAALESKYKPVEEYYSQHPDRWQYINQQYETLKQGLDPSNPLAQKLQLLETKLSQADQFIQNQIQREELQKIQKEDQELDQDIHSIRDQYKDLDWNSVDSSGKNLELKILEHAQAIGTKSFRAAFRDFYHDQLVKLHEERAKENVVKERQKQTKLGLLGQSSTPKMGLQNVQDIKGKSYDDLTREALEELGIA